MKSYADIIGAAMGAVIGGILAMGTHHVQAWLPIGIGVGLAIGIEIKQKHKRIARS